VAHSGFFQAHYNINGTYTKVTAESGAPPGTFDH
jgi:hypothetical protein